MGVKGLKVSVHADMNSLECEMYKEAIKEMCAN